jgi:hypothetical protein
MSVAIRRAACALSLLALCAPVLAVGQAKEPSAVSAWVAVPAAGATATAAYVEISNPGMYDIYVVSATADGTAGTVELRSPAAGGGEAPAVTEFAVPAYGSIGAAADAPHLRLVDLSRPLKAGDTVALVLTTDAGIKLKVAATVRAQ